MSFPPFIGTPTLPEEASKAMAATLGSRFLAKIEQTEDCWRWTAMTNGVGYGAISVNHSAKKVLAHRLAYEFWVGPIPNGLVIDHLCRNPSCVRPDHLEAVTFRENVLSGNALSAQQARQTHCKRGHPFDAENTRITKDGKRTCRECRKEAAARLVTARPPRVCPICATEFPAVRKRRFCSKRCLWTDGNRKKNEARRGWVDV